MPRRSIVVAGAILVLAAIAAALVYLFVDFTPSVPPQETAAIVGHSFPTVSAKDLKGTACRLPADFAGGPLIVLVTPSKQAQADADKWIADLRGRRDVEFRETPIITSKVAGLMQGFISGKMRDGLPEDMWPRVIPLFDGGESLLAFFGDYGDALTWVAVLDAHGSVRWFAAEGYSAALAAGAVEKYVALQ